MRLFISWSGSTSRQVAYFLRDWMQNVIQAIKPWMSDEDIRKGGRWLLELARELEATDACIICVTPDNLSSPWIHFEAGAAAKVLDKSVVCPYLFKLYKSDLTGPLAQFQAATADRDETFKLVESLNRALGNQSLESQTLNRAFAKFWPDFEAQLNQIQLEPKSDQPIRAERELLEEILGRIRRIESEKATHYIQGPNQTRTPNRSTVQDALREANLLIKGVDASIASTLENWLHDGHMRDALRARDRINEIIQAPEFQSWRDSSEVRQIIQRMEQLIDSIDSRLSEQNDHLMNQP